MRKPAVRTWLHPPPTNTVLGVRSWQKVLFQLEGFSLTINPNPQVFIHMLDSYKPGHGLWRTAANCTAWAPQISLTAWEFEKWWPLFKSNLKTVYSWDMIRRYWWNPADCIGAQSETWRRECVSSSVLHLWLSWYCTMLCSLSKEQATSRLLFIHSCKKRPHEITTAVGINGSTTAFFNLISL